MEGGVFGREIKEKGLGPAFEWVLGCSPEETRNPAGNLNERAWGILELPRELLASTRAQAAPQICSVRALGGASALAF